MNIPFSTTCLFAITAMCKHIRTYVRLLPMEFVWNAKIFHILWYCNGIWKPNEVNNFIRRYKETVWKAEVDDCSFSSKMADTTTLTRTYTRHKHCNNLRLPYQFGMNFLPATVLTGTPINISTESHAQAKCVRG